MKKYRNMVGYEVTVLLQHDYTVDGLRETVMYLLKGEPAGYGWKQQGRGGQVS